MSHISLLSTKKTLITVWQCPKVEKLPNNTWFCHWCKKSKNGHNHNRALSHVSRTHLHGQKGIQFCDGEIDDVHLSRHQDLARRVENKKTSKKDRVVRHVENVRNMQKLAALNIEATSKKAPFASPSGFTQVSKDSSSVSSKKRTCDETVSDITDTCKFF